MRTSASRARRWIGGAGSLLVTLAGCKGTHDGAPAPAAPPPSTSVAAAPAPSAAQTPAPSSAQAAAPDPLPSTAAASRYSATPEPAPGAGPGERPLRWTKHVDLKDLASLPAAMEANLTPNGKALSLASGEKTPAGKPATIEVGTCARYLQAIDDGYRPESTFDISQESFFKARCAPLWFLRASRPSRESHVKDLRLDVPAPLSTLPGRLNVFMEAPTEEEDAAMAKGAALAAINPKAKVKRKDATSVVFVDPETQIEATVDVIAWGDFDRDGLEDVLLFQAGHSLEGSYRMYRHLIVTRKAAGAPLVVLREVDI